MAGVVRSGTRVAGFGADAARGVDGLFDPKLFSNKLLKKGSGVDLVDLDLLTDVQRADVLANMSKTGKLGEFDDLVKNSDFIALKKLDDVLPPNTVARKAYDDGVKSQVELNKLATGTPTSVSNVDELGTVTGVPVEKLNKQATMWQKVVNGDTLIQQGLKKLGYTNIAIGGFVIMVLCMMYDTDNPFKALDRALDDAGTSIRAIKEVAEEAGEAAVDLTKGGFNLVSFVSKNSGLSSACSILCLILIAAMVMLSFMSGGKSK